MTVSRNSPEALANLRAAIKSLDRLPSPAVREGSRQRLVALQELARGLAFVHSAMRSGAWVEFELGVLAESAEELARLMGADP